MHTSRFSALILIAFTLYACHSPNNKKTEKTMEINDTHTYAKPNDAVITHLDLNIQIDFNQHQISGTASYQIDHKSKGKEIIFDTRDMDILDVVLDDGTKATWTLGDADEFMGKSLSISIKPLTKSLSITYKTHPEAAGLQWLDPQQTAGKKHPFLFTQSEAILARTWIPIQDSPGIRFSYNAKVQVPKGLLALMSASNPQKINTDGEYNFVMKQPIPAYLMALAVGNIVFRPEGLRTGVYAEPEIIDKAAWEFAEMEDMLTTAEKLYGPYRWERYDLIVLPPSFPFGGMENPRLTFATPTVIAGDRSLTALVAHELAHSWSGNLVTNANWNDFWLNEGFTVYFERRITEALKGKTYAEMLAQLGYQDLVAETKRLTQEEKAADTHLKLQLDGRDPDDGMTDIAYEKGYALLRHIEKSIGREKWDAFLKNYFNTNAFQSMTTEAFLDYTEDNLIKGNDSLRKVLNMKQWIYEAGIPDDIDIPHSDVFEKVEQNISDWQNGKALGELPTGNWTSHEWQHFLRKMPDTLTLQEMQQLDEIFHFSKSGNSEIVALWLELAIKHDYETAYPVLDSFLVNVGRRKFLIPLYTALIKTEKGKKMAMDIYRKARPNYHSVSYNSVDELLGWKAE